MPELKFRVPLDIRIPAVIIAIPTYNMNLKFTPILLKRLNILLLDIDIS